MELSTNRERHSNLNSLLLCSVPYMRRFFAVSSLGWRIAAGIWLGKPRRARNRDERGFHGPAQTPRLIGHLRQLTIAEDGGDIFVCENRVRLALQSFVVLLAELIARFRRHEQRTRLGQQNGGIRRCRWLLVFEDFVNAYDQLGNAVQPGELLVIDQELKKLA